MFERNDIVILADGRIFRVLEKDGYVTTIQFLHRNAESQISSYDNDFVVSSRINNEMATLNFYLARTVLMNKAKR